MKKALSLMVVLSLCLSLLAGCGSTADTTDSTGTTNTSSSSTSTATSGADALPGTSTDATGLEEPDGIVPGTLVNVYTPADFISGQLPDQARGGRWMTTILYDTLFYSPSGDWTDITGLLVEDWTISDDYLTWVLNLHDDVKFANGNPLTAQTVADNFDYKYDVGAASSLTTVDSYEVTGEYQLTLHFNTPNNEFMNLMSVSHMGIFDVESYYANGADLTASYKVGSGPYYASDYALGDYITFTANPDYWREDRMPHIETIVCKFIDDSSTQVTTLTTSDMDYGYFDDVYTYELLDLEDHLTILSDPGTNRTLWFNVDSGFCEYLSNIRVREALTMMIDTEELAYVSSGGLGSSNVSALAAVEYEGNRTYDPEGAIAILAEEGLTPEDIVLTGVCAVAQTTMFTNLQAQFAESGVTFDFFPQDTAASSSTGMSGEWDVWCESGGVTFGSYYNYLNNIMGASASTLVIRDQEMAPLVADMVSEIFAQDTDEKKMDMIMDLQGMLDENYQYIATVSKYRFHAFNEKIVNPVIDANGACWLPWFSWVAE